MTREEREALGDALRKLGWLNNPHERSGDFGRGTWEKLCDNQRLRVVLLARTGVALFLEVPIPGGGHVIALVGRAVGPTWASDTAARLDEAACTYLAANHAAQASNA